MSYTIYDLAKDADVSVATVSRVINNSGTVKAKTKEKILELMKEKDFKPNAFARGLNNISMRTIGVIISDIANPFFAEVVKGIDSMFQQSGYKLILCSTDNNSETEKREIEILVQKHVEGFIVVGSRPQKDPNSSLLTELSKTFPVILINSYIKGGDKLYSILVDEEKAAYDAITYLIKNGHKNIYFLGDPGWKTTSVKVSAMKTIFNECGMTYNDDNFISCDYSYDGGVCAAQFILEKKLQLPYTLFCASDMIAIGAMRILLKSGVKIPDEVSIMGYSNMQVSSLMTPSLSTVDQKMFSLGEKSAVLFFDIMEGRYPLNKKIYSDYELIIRESTLNI